MVMASFPSATKQLTRPGTATSFPLRLRLHYKAAHAGWRQVSRSPTKNQCEYREFAKAANVLGRSVIEETIDVIRPAYPRIANKLQTIIERGPIEKPERHQGGKETDLFRVVLEQREFEAIVEVFGDLEVANVSSEGKTTSLAAHYADLLDLWSEVT